MTIPNVPPPPVQQPQPPQSNAATPQVPPPPVQQSQPPRSNAAAAHATQSAASPQRYKARGPDSFLDKLKGVSWKVWAAIGVVLVLLAVLFYGWQWFSTPTSPSGGGGYVAPQNPIVTTQAAPSVNWTQSGLATVKPPEQSPMRNGVFQPKDTVLVFLMFVIVVTLATNIVLDWREGGEGNEEWWEKIATLAQSASGAVAGILFPWVFSWGAVYKDGLWFFAAFIVLACLFSVSLARAIKDGTSLNSFFALFAASLAIRGISEIPIGLANVAGWADKAPWQGFYSFTGFLTLIVGLRTAEAALTGVIYLLLFGAFAVSAVETLKKYQPNEAVVAVMFVIAAVTIGNFASQSLFNLMTPTSMDQLIAMEIAKPILGWALGVLGAIIGSLFLKGKEFKVRGITMQMAQVSGAQSIVNFIALMTTLSIIVNLVVR